MNCFLYFFALPSVNNIFCPCKYLASVITIGLSTKITGLQAQSVNIVSQSSLNITRFREMWNSSPVHDLSSGLYFLAQQGLRPICHFSPLKTSYLSGPDNFEVVNEVVLQYEAAAIINRLLQRKIFHLHQLYFPSSTATGKATTTTHI